MWVYKPKYDLQTGIKTKEFQVGYYAGSSTTFQPMETYPTEGQARQAVHFLNGGN